MKRTRFSDSKILSILEEFEQGASVEELSNKYGFHYQTLYSWKRRFKRVSNVSQLAQLKELTQQHEYLKKMYTELLLEHNILKDVLSKKW